MQILRTIAIIAFIYYGLKFLTRTVFPWILKRWLNKKMTQFQNQGNAQDQEQQKSQKFSKEQEGEVKIQSRGSKTKSDTENIGDFVDYEEIEE